MARSLARPTLVAALVALGVAVPAAAQFSDSYNFLKAVRDRDGAKATELLDKAADTLIDTRERGTGDSALHIVAARRDAAWLSFMLAKGANPNQQNNAGDTPMLTAARIGFTEGVDALIRRQAQVDRANRAGETPLIVAVQNRDMATVRTLLAARADPTLTDSVAGMSARDYAERDGRSQAILRLIDERGQAPREHRPVAGPE